MFGVKTISLTPKGSFAKLPDGLGSHEYRMANVDSDTSDRAGMLMKPNSTKEWAQKNDFEFSCPHSAVDATHRNSWTPGCGRTVSGC
jgi:hypothetical protein